MSKVKAIDLDDMDFDALPNPIGGSPDNGAHGTDMNYLPNYASSSSMSDAHDFDEGTVKHGGRRFYLPANLTRFTQVFGGRKLGGADNRQIILASVMGCIFLSAGLYIYLGEDFLGDLLGNSSSTGADVIAEDDSLPSEDPLPVEDKMKTGIEVMTPPLDETKAEPPKLVEEIAGNAYWKLPNPSPPLIDTSVGISPQQSDSWRAGLNHPFTHQRYKTTQEMRKTKVEGSVTILYEALVQPKFWTRMEALLGIAEHGVAIDNESMKTAIGDARPDLVKNYFKRFRKNYTDATAHVMRQAMRVVDGPARAVILNNLATHRGEVNDQYLYAASLNETDSVVKELGSKILFTHPLPAAHKLAYEKSMTSETVEIAAPKRKVPEEIQVDKIPSNMKVEEVYFINDEPSVSAPVVVPVKTEIKKVDDGFNDIQHTEDVVQ